MKNKRPKRFPPNDERTRMCFCVTAVNTRILLNSPMSVTNKRKSQRTFKMDFGASFCTVKRRQIRQRYQNIVLFKAC